MNMKLIASDLDRILRKDDKIISDLTHQTLEQVRRKERWNGISA